MNAGSFECVLGSFENVQGSFEIVPVFFLSVWTCQDSFGSLECIKSAFE